MVRLLSNLYFNQWDIPLVPDIVVELENDDPFGGMNSKNYEIRVIKTGLA
jgi:hypothetical protein